MNLFIRCLFLLLIAFNSYTQLEDHVVGKQFSIESKVLNEHREILIYLPKGYHSSKKEYPVLYLLDGQRFQMLGVSILESFIRNKLSPEFIIVGINTTYPDRYHHFQKTAFLEFMEKELINHIDKTFRTTNERILYGWEFAGGYVIESLVSKPSLFTGHIAASPLPINITWFAEKTRIEQLDEKLKDLNSHLYFSISDEELLEVSETTSLDSLLNKKAPHTFRWKYRVINDGSHQSTAYSTLYQGLRHYFYNYPVFTIKSLNNFIDVGELEYFYRYNKSRAKRFGFSDEPEALSVLSIIDKAMKANNLTKFSLYMNEFKSFDFISQLELNEARRMARFYLKYKKYTEAADLYTQLARTNPRSAQIRNELGHIYLNLKDIHKAKTFFKKAVELAEVTNDKHLSDYKSDFKPFE